MNIVVVNRQRTRKINRRFVKQVVASLLAELKIQNAELGINFLTKPEMAQINEEFLQHVGSTDVIAFDYRDSEFGVGNPEFQLHGEIFICVDEAIRQAHKFRTSWQLEIARYLVHGVLHLLDYDDSNASKRRKMKRAENSLLRQLSRRFSLAQLSRRAKLGA